MLEIKAIQLADGSNVFLEMEIVENFPTVLQTKSFSGRDLPVGAEEVNATSHRYI